MKSIDMWIAPLLIGLVYVCYAGTLNAEFFHSWDDNHYVTDNQLIRDFNLRGLWDLFSQPHFWHYIPITLLSYMIDYRLWEFDSFGYHLTNILLHALNGGLVYIVCARLQSSRVAAALAAIIFVIHPVQVESVAWVSERKNLLSLLFFLLAFWAHMRSRAAGTSRLLQGLAWSCFGLAVLAKSIVVCTPILFIIYDILWARRRVWPSLITNLPYTLMGGFGGVVTLIAQQGSSTISGYWDNHFGRNAVLMLRVVWEYAASLVLPLNLGNMYLYTRDMIQGDVRLWLGALVLIFAGLIARRQPFGAPLSRFAVLWAAAFFLPVANLFPYAIQRADRYLYQPSVVIFLLASVSVIHLWQRLSSRTARGILLGLIGLLVLLGVRQTQQYTTVWANSETLWRHHLAQYPESPLGLLNLGVHYYRQKEYAKGYPIFQKLQQLRPRYRKAYRYLAQCAFGTNRGEEAIQTYASAINIWPQDKVLHNDMGYAYYRMGRLREALASYQKASALDVTYQRPRVNLLQVGQAALRAHNYTLARQAFETIRHVYPK